MRRLLPAVLGIALLVLGPALPAHAAATITPQIQLVAADYNLTYEHQSTTVTGTVTYTATDGTTQPLANQQVQISCYEACASALFTVTTDAKGQFTVPVTAQWNQMSVTATIVATSTVATATNTVHLSANSRTRITATAAPDTLTSPTPAVTISGVLQYEGDDGTWKPLPDRTIQVSELGTVYTPATTAADGTFTATLTLTRSTTAPTQQVDARWIPSTMADETFFSWADTTVTVTNFDAQVSFTSFTATANADGTITVGGELTIDPVYFSVTVQIEYSADGASGWQPLGSPLSPSGGSFGPTTFQAPLPAAWYRAAVLPGPGTLGTASAAVKAGRTVTRVSRFKVSAAKVKAGLSFKITGALQQDVNGTWKALAGQQVWILLQPKGSSTWYWYSKPVTASTGKFSATIKVGNGMPCAWWIPAFQGAGGFYASSPAKAKYVTVR